MLNAINGEKPSDGMYTASHFAVRGNSVASASQRSDTEPASASEQPVQSTNGVHGLSDQPAPPSSPDNSVNHHGLTSGLSALGLSSLLRPVENSGSRAVPSTASLSGGIAAVLRDVVMRRTTGNSSLEDPVIKEFANGDRYSGHWKQGLVRPTSLPLCSVDSSSPSGLWLSHLIIMVVISVLDTQYNLDPRSKPASELTGTCMLPCSRTGWESIFGLMAAYTMADGRYASVVFPTSPSVFQPSDEIPF